MIGIESKQLFLYLVANASSGKRVFHPVYGLRKNADKQREIKKRYEQGAFLGSHWFLCLFSASAHAMPLYACTNVPFFYLSCVN